MPRRRGGGHQARRRDYPAGALVTGRGDELVTVDELDAIRQRVNESTDLTALEQAISARSQRIIAEMPVVPSEKALLSRDGGTCPRDGATLDFDPWTPAPVACPECGAAASGERHRRWWARYQHLWIAEQAASLAALAALGGHDDAGRRAVTLLDAYAQYTTFPNRDNVLGPSRLFFSTYLESVWLTNYLAAAVLLREVGALPEPTVAIVNEVADDAASLIGEFSEGFSNRQVWHDAALAAVAVWFEDEELAERALQGDVGLLTLLARGVGGDGMWHEGENYHLFALQGMLVGMRWARLCGMDLPADPAIAAHLSAALRAPMLTALPDGTFPARKDARFGVSLAQPMYLELWEVGLGLLQGRDGADLAGMADWLQQRYRAPAPPARFFDSWLYEAGTPAPAMRDRTSLSWNVLLEGVPALRDEPDWVAPSALLPSQGLAILRTARRYVSLETGPWSGGHGHPDRLHLSYFADGVNWLPDPGTGNYVDRDLFWYRSTLAHNAPMLDGDSQQGDDAHCDAFDVGADWSWVQGSWGSVIRTVVAGPSYVLDVVQASSQEARTVEVPWHPEGLTRSGLRLAPADLDLGEFAHDAGTVVPESDGLWHVTAAQAGTHLTMTFAGTGQLYVADGPGLPGGGEQDFLVRRDNGVDVRFVTVITDGTEAADVTIEGASIVVTIGGRRDTHAELTDGWEVQAATGRVRLGGRLLHQPPFEPLLTRIRREPMRGAALRIGSAPALDGSLDGFDDSAPLMLDHDDQYRRGELPYQGPDSFSASVAANWDYDALYLAVEVRKEGGLIFRPASAPPLNLDNEPDDINSDGLQLFLALPEGGAWGVIVVPEEGGALRVSAVSDAIARPEDVSGAWQRTDEGYRVTLALAPAAWRELADAPEVRFDVAVNEMQPERERRVAQLIWSGGGGWIYLRGDRQDLASFGVLELA
jgi:hypothetical protein